MQNIDPASVIQSSGIVTVGSTSTTVLAPFDNRRTVIIQNLSTVSVYVMFGSPATTSTGGFSFILPPGTSANDGTGGVFTEDTLSYQGIITAIVASGTADLVVTSI